MKKTCIIITLALASLLAADSCTVNKPSGGGNVPSGGDPSLPEPPEIALDARTFMVDIFTTLSDESFFNLRSTGVACEYIRTQQQKRSLVYLFDRADYTVGKNHPMTEIAYTLGMNQLFAQSGPTGLLTTEGTGIITAYPIANYDGIAEDGAYLSGCRISIPVTGTPSVYVSTARISSMDQARSIYEKRKLRLTTDAVVIGTAAAEEKQQILDFFNSSSVRAACLGSGDTDYDLIVLCPANYVCRGIEPGKTANLPYYRVSIEKWN